MAERVLITGGAGFIGRHVVSNLLARGHRVRVLDSLIEQVHGGKTDGKGGRPEALDPEAELVVADVRDENQVLAALKDVDSVIHLAAEVGVGQSMYQVDRYTSVNDYGTAVLFQQLIEKRVRRVVVASSMSIYGEGLYRTADGLVMEEVVRVGRAANGAWDPVDAQGRPMTPLPTPESKRPNLASVYALGKYVQERLTLTLSPAYGMECAALRLWNVYGPGQALSNPYTGVLAIFSSRLANGQRPMVFEDGQQQRDFVHVSDVAEAFALALEHSAANGGVFNIGSGEVRTVTDVAAGVAQAMNRQDLTPEITDKSRVGDIRHCIPDVGKARVELGFSPKQDWMAGLVELAEWVSQQEASDRVEQARGELEARGLVA